MLSVASVLGLVFCIFTFFCLLFSFFCTSYFAGVVALKIWHVCSDAVCKGKNSLVVTNRHDLMRLLGNNL